MVGSRVIIRRLRVQILWPGVQESMLPCWLDGREKWHTFCPLSITMTLGNRECLWALYAGEGGEHFPPNVLLCPVTQFEKMWLAGFMWLEAVIWRVGPRTYYRETGWNIQNKQTNKNIYGYNMVQEGTNYKVCPPGKWNLQCVAHVIFFQKLN